MSPWPPERLRPDATSQLSVGPPMQLPPAFAYELYYADTHASTERACLIETFCCSEERKGKSDLGKEKESLRQPRGHVIRERFPKKQASKGYQRALKPEVHTACLGES
eukprot:1151487-Pelagomonas_calceolata.AAC.3